jgi:hypothetical protein
VTQTPPGWYDQQSATAPLRWFDGARWTDYSRLDYVPHERRHVFMKHDAGPGWLRLSTALMWLLGGCGLLVIVSLAYYVWLTGEVSDWQVQPPTDAELDRLVEREELLALTRGLGVLGTGIVFMVWLHLAHRSDRLADDRRTHRSFWSWLGWLIPFVNLIMPAKMVNEVRTASQPEDRPPAKGLLGAWWACLLLGWIISVVTGTDTADSVEEFESMMRSAIVSDLFFLAAAVLVVLLVREIRERVRTSPYGPRRNPLAQPANPPVSGS